MKLSPDNMKNLDKYYMKIVVCKICSNQYGLDGKEGNKNRNVCPICNEVGHKNGRKKK